MNFFEKYRRSVAILLVLLLAIITMLIWNANKNQLQESLKSKVMDTNKLVLQQFREAIKTDISRLANLKKRLEVTDGQYFEYWDFDAALIVQQDPTFLFIEWIDSSMVIQLVEPIEGNEQALNLDISKLDYRNTDWNTARKDSVFNLTQWLELTQGDSAFLVDEPVYYNGEFQGTITAGMDFSSRFDKIMERLEQYHLHIRDEQETTFYTFGDSTGTSQFEDMAVIDSIQIGDANNSRWATYMVPNYIFANQNSTMGYLLSLALALLLCVLLAVSFFYMQKSSASEKSALKANRRLRAFIDSAPIAIYIIDSEGHVVDFWNTAAEDMLGWKQEEIMGKFLPHVSSDHRQDFKRLIKDIKKEGKLVSREITLTRKNGQRGTFRLNVGKVVGEDQHMLALLEDITKEKQFEKQLKQSLREKSFLLAEIHHRVKNNLAIIVGLIELHNNDVDDDQTKALLNETKNRIFSISEVHELLYQTESFAEISFGEYIDALVNRLQQTYRDDSQDVTIIKNLANFHVNINQAIPLGLLLNELITNSYKHAFKGIQHPKIHLELSKNSEYVKISYRDNGTGFDQSVYEQATSLGVVLTKTLLNQLEAEYEIKKSNGGFNITFQFPIEKKGAHANI